jgi:hypothetical protein
VWQCLTKIVRSRRTVTSIEFAQAIYSGFYGDVKLDNLPMRDQLTYRLAAVEVLKKYHVTPA